MKTQVALVLLFSAGAAAVVQADLAGPPPGHTGAPGEQTCATSGCHEGADQAPSPGLYFVPYSEHRDTVSVRVILHPGNAAFATGHIGFQAVFVDPSGAAIGSLISWDTAIYLIDTGSTGRIYISQTETGRTFDPPTSNFISYAFRSYAFRWDRSLAPNDSAMLTCQPSGPTRTQRASEIHRHGTRCGFIHAPCR